MMQILKNIINNFFKIIGGLSILLGILSVLKIGTKLYENPDSQNIITALIIILVLVIIYSYIEYKRQIVNVKIAYFSNLLIYIPIYVAKQKNFFKKERLNIQFFEGGNDDRVWELVSAKEADFGISDPTLIIGSNIKAKVISSIVQKPAMWVISNKNIPYSNKTELFNGKTIAVYKNPSTSYHLIENINSTLDKKMKIIEMETNAEINYITSSEIDFVVVTEPILTQILNSVENSRIVFSFSKYYNSMLFTGLYSTEKYLLENPKIAQKLTNSFQKSLDYISKNKIDTVKLLKKEFPEFSESVILEAYSRLLKNDIIPENISIKNMEWNNMLKLKKIEINEINNKYIDNAYAKETIKRSTAPNTVYS